MKIGAFVFLMVNLSHNQLINIMLTKNGEKYHITEEEKQLLAEKFDRFPIVIKYLPKHYRTMVKTNKVKATTSISLPLVANKLTDKGIDQWRYYENVTQRDAMGKETGFSPSMFSINKTAVICADPNRMNIELLYFLAFCSPFVENSTNRDPNIEPSVVIEEKAKEAQVRVKAKQEALKIDKYIYGDILTKDMKRELCVALAIRVPEGMSEEEMAIELDKAVSISSRVREDFLKLIEDNFLREVRYEISVKAEAGNIRFEKAEGRWYYVDPISKKKMDSICRVSSLSEPNIALAEYLLSNKQALADFKQNTSVKEKKGNFAKRNLADDSTKHKADVQSGSFDQAV